MGWFTFLVGLAVAGLVLSPLRAQPADDSAIKNHDPRLRWKGWVDRGRENLGEQFSLARGARSFPIPPDDPRLAGKGRGRLPLALRRGGPRQPVILMSASGGGSRAAYYAACVMENLSRVPLDTSSGRSTVMEQVRALSGVSGGGLAAAWYALHHPERTGTGFYPRLRSAMAVNLQWSAYGGIALFPPLALQVAGPTVNRTDLLARRIEQVFEKGPVTFRHLEEQENNGADPAPILLVNGTVYNSGQRFVMGNVGTEFLPSIFPHRARSVTNHSVESSYLRLLLEPVTAEQVGIDIRQLRLATALSASAAFPVILAPVPLQVWPGSIPPQLVDRGPDELRESTFLHIADGGLHDNFGTDSLMSLVRALPPDQPVMVIIIDATLRSQTLKLGRSKIWWPWTSVLRMYDIGSLRGLGMVGAMMADLRPRGNYSTVFIKMAAHDRQGQSVLNRIPTSFAISHGNRQDLEAIALANVQSVSASIQREYNRLRAGGRGSERMIYTKPGEGE